MEKEPTVLTYWLDVHPDNVLNANDRKHWGSTTGPRQVLRTQGRSYGALAKQPLLRHIRFDAWVSYPDRIPRDVLNLYPTMKAFGDGLVDARVIPDDNDLYMSGPFMRWAGRLSRKPGWFEFSIRITEIDPPEFDPKALAPSLAAKLGLASDV